MEYTSAFVDLRPEDVILFYTDGLSEAMDGEGREFGDDRVRQLLVDTRHHDPRTITQNLLETVRQFDPSVPPQDDTTTIVLKIQNGNTPHD
jgi:sigma-B regulation protein RsbU (phosphoserine phosphatase)